MLSEIVRLEASIAERSANIKELKRGEKNKRDAKEEEKQKSAK